jgi:hypothetical protein
MTNTTTKPQRPRRRRLIVAAAAIAVVLAASVTTAVVTANAVAAETAKQCRSARAGVALTWSVIPDSLSAARDAVAKVQTTALPGTDGWTTTNYADRPGADAADGKPARPSAQSLITAVTVARTALNQSSRDASCTTREQAAALNSRSKQQKTAADALDADTKALLEDFTAFQAAEKTRIAAEVEAKRIAAEAAAAAQKAAEEKAQQEAAAAEAARQAAEERQSSSTSRGTSNGSAPSNPAPAPHGHLGGSVGGGPVGSGAGGCQTSNGMGGTTRC